jgi:hypothetical protein
MYMRSGYLHPLAKLTVGGSHREKSHPAKVSIPLLLDSLFALSFKYGPKDMENGVEGVESENARLYRYFCQ